MAYSTAQIDRRLSVHSQKLISYYLISTHQQCIDAQDMHMHSIPIPIRTSIIMASKVQLLICMLLISASTTMSFMIAPTISTSITSTCTTSSTWLREREHEHEHDHEHHDNIPMPGQTKTKSPVPVTGVTLKMAFDKNYAVADSSEFKSTRFTSPQSLDLVHQLRRNSDCVLVGKGTVIRDDCTLTVRRVDLFAHKGQPARVVIDSNLEILAGSEDNDIDIGNTIGNEEEKCNQKDTSKSFALLQDGFNVIVYHSCPLEKIHQHALDINSSLTLVQLPTVKGAINGNSKEGMSPMQIIQDLQSRNIHHVMVEGGPATAIPFLEGKVIDRAIIIRAPVTFIEPVVSNMNDDMLTEAGLVLLDEKDVGGDMVEYWVREGMDWPTVSVADWPH